MSRITIEDERKAAMRALEILESLRPGEVMDPEIAKELRAIADIASKAAKQDQH